MEIIGHIYTDFDEKFGIPRQSGIVDELIGKIIFLPEYRQPEAFRGLKDFSYIWLLWEFHMANRATSRATVKPPKLGGNKRMGVFATRSPYRPNNIGLSSVKLLDILYTEKNGPVLIVSGADLLNGTPIYDIKPYLAFTDSHPDARGGFTADIPDTKLEVNFPDELLKKIPEDKQTPLIHVLAEDPRPGYQDDPTRRYGVLFAGFDVRFYVKDGMLTVCEVVKQ